MRDSAILIPLCAQVLLTLVVWTWMYYTRLTAIARSGVRVQDLADDARFDVVTAAVKNPSDNFENQFEMPVLFYVAATLIFTTAMTDGMDVGLAWIFVALRALHALIHCTSNRIRYRFATYALSSLVVWGMWIRLTLQLAQA